MEEDNEVLRTKVKWDDKEEVKDKEKSRTNVIRRTIEF